MKKESVAEYLARGGKIKTIAPGVSGRDDNDFIFGSVTPRPLRHGKTYTYTAKKCRCTACVVAYRTYCREAYRKAHGVTPDKYKVTG